MAKRRRRSLIDAPAITRTPAPAPGRSGRLAPPQATEGGSVDDIEAVLAKEHGGTWTPPSPPGEPEPEPAESAEASAPAEPDPLDAPAMPPAQDLDHDTGSTFGGEDVDLVGGQESFDLFGFPETEPQGAHDDDTMTATVTFGDSEEAMAAFEAYEVDPDEQSTQVFDRDNLPEDLATLMDEEEGDGEQAELASQDEEVAGDADSDSPPRLSKGIPEGFPTDDEVQPAPGEETIQLASTNTPTMDREQVPDTGLPEASAYAEPEALAVGDVPEPDPDEDLQDDTFEMAFFSNDNWDERMDDLPKLVATRPRPVPPPSMATLLATALSSVIVAMLVLGFAASMVKAERDADADRIAQQERAVRASARAQAAEEARIRKEMLARPPIDLSGATEVEEEEVVEEPSGEAGTPRRQDRVANEPKSTDEPSTTEAPKPFFFTPAPKSEDQPAPAPSSSSDDEDKRGLFRRKN